MPIYEMFASKEESPPPEKARDRFFSSLTARVLFLLLLVADVGWVVWTFFKIALCLLLYFLPVSRKALGRAWVALRRASVCLVSLVVALFSPPLGIMVACTYFLMYDKSGIHEVVPRSLQDQFQDFINESKVQ